ncbi:hypothetical protein [Psychrobacter sp. BF1]|uniref:hypothetical protein n=1 Tax=Psychrobacter sp. BF1 TaxID=2821147 RepID=UPI001C4E1915|nr:hypothetical protein [Psychrobacter sp. BF1]
MAVQHTDKSALELNTEFNDPWSIIADRFNVKVDGLQSERVLGSAAKLNIVNVYSGLDLYLTAYRKEYENLFQTDWKNDPKKTPIDKFRSNIDVNDIESVSNINSHILKLIDYYRLVRNATVHPSKENRLSVDRFFKRESDSFVLIRNQYGMVSAPNSFDSLNFHDAKLFTNILLDILPLFEEKLDPGDKRLKETIPLKTWSTQAEIRRKNYAIGFLRSEYGISYERCEKILAY